MKFTKNETVYDTPYIKMFIMTLPQSRTCYGSKWLEIADQLPVQVSAELFLFCTESLKSWC